MGRRSFSREFKLAAERLVRKRGVSIAQAAPDLHVHENVLRKWVKELVTNTGDGHLPAQPAERSAASFR